MRQGLSEEVFAHYTLRPRKNWRHFADDILKWIFVNENVKISTEISLKFVPKVQITIFKHWFRQWLGAVQARSHYLNQWWLFCRRIYASLGLNEIIICLHREYTMYFETICIRLIMVKLLIPNAHASLVCPRLILIFHSIKRPRWKT